MKKETYTHAALKLEDVARSDPRETIRRASRMVSSRVGIVQQVSNGVHLAQDPATFAMGVMAGDISRYTDTVNSSKGGGGGDSLIGALAATLGEAAERYCMFFYDKSEMVFAPYNEIAADAVSPDYLRLYSRHQIEGLGPNARVRYFDNDLPVRWVWGYSLTEERPRLVPASLVYMNYQFGDSEPVIGRNASSGLAANLTVEEAILNAILEIVERDAFTICWLSKRPGRKIIVDDEGLQGFLRQRFHFDHPKVETIIHDITLDVPIPSLFCVIKRPTELGPTVCVGSTSRLDPKQALRKCFFEAGQGIPYMRYLLSQLKDWEPSPDFMDLTAFDHHCVFYLKRPDLVPEAFAFLDEVDGTIPLSSVTDQSTGRVLGDVQRCVELLKLAGLEVIVVEITTPDIRDIGMRVVRVLIPGMVPLHGVYKFPFLGSKRLAQFPMRGSSNQGNGQGPQEFNKYPHPFP
jgi:ribosomal protein S12 methylthiotransferase accessory factor